MRIISWNCRMAFRKKAHLINVLNPDIVIIQECEHIDKIPSSPEIKEKIWYGESTNKGVGIFSYNSKISFSEIKIDLKKNKWFIPISTNAGINFMAVWAMNHRGNKPINKIQPTYRTITEKKEIFQKMDFIIGDFNNNIIWDKSSKWDKGSFSEIIHLLSSLGLNSAYHLNSQEEFGKESASTHYWSGRKYFHIDYAFINNQKHPNINFRILSDAEWLENSDHRPLILDIMK